MLQPMTHPLDRPIWHALSKRQAGFAVGGGLARRFDPKVSPLIACVAVRLGPCLRRGTHYFSRLSTLDPGSRRGMESVK